MIKGLKKTAMAICLGLLPLTALAADPGKTRRASDLYQKPSYSASKLEKLKTGTSLKVLERRGAWFFVEVDKNSQQGWVRMLNIRLGSSERKKGSSGIGALSQFARTGSSGRVVATGVRGLNEESIKNAKPAPREFKKMTEFQVSQGEARDFARKSNLSAREISYLDPAKDSKSGSNFSSDDDEEEGFF
jgi:hypothetical protein